MESSVKGNWQTETKPDGRIELTYSRQASVWVFLIVMGFLSIFTIILAFMALLLIPAGILGWVLFSSGKIEIVPGEGLIVHNVIGNKNLPFNEITRYSCQRSGNGLTWFVYADVRGKTVTVAPLVAEATANDIMQFLVRQR